MSPEFQKRLERAKSDYAEIQLSQKFRRGQTDRDFEVEFSTAKALLMEWLQRTEPYFETLSDYHLSPIATFLEGVTKSIDSPPSGQTMTNSLRIVKGAFIRDLPLLAYGVIEASGLLSVTGDSLQSKGKMVLGDIDRRAVEVTDEFERFSRSAEETLISISDSTKIAKSEIERTALDVLESAKRTASKISVEAAQEQFKEAAGRLRKAANRWMYVAGAFSFALIVLLMLFNFDPPQLIHDIMIALKPGSAPTTVIQGVSSVPIPLLVAASAYFTSMRLALIGILGVGLAFSLRMARAYFHMAEHNEHKLRVTNSIEAFVAAVRLPEQKDLVLSKLVDSVIDFGDSGILGKQGDSSGIPSIIFDSITKNVSKSD